MEIEAGQIFLDEEGKVNHGQSTTKDVRDLQDIGIENGTIRILHLPNDYFRIRTYNNGK